MNPEDQLLNTPGLTQGQLVSGFLGQENARPATPATPGQPNSSIIAQMLKKLREMLQPGGQP